MAVTDIAQRVYDHTWKLDPIVRSILDTDFYKLLMLQMIRGLYPDVHATFSIINRTRRVRLAEDIDEKELRDQLDHARTVRLSKKELIWLAGNSFYGRRQIFGPDFLAWLAEFQLPGIRADPARRAVRARFHRPLVAHLHVGDPGARHHQRAALAGGAEGDRPLRARRPLCARQGEALGQGRAPARAAGPAHLRFRHAPPAQLPLAEMVRGGAEGGPRPGLRRDEQCAPRHGQRPGSDRHQRARAADGAGGAGDERRGAARRALSRPAGLAALLRRQPPHRAARYVRNHRLPAQRSRLGRRLDRLPAGFHAADRRRRADHRVVARQGARPARKAPRLLRRARRRHDHLRLPAFRRQGADELWLGHEPHQRFSRLRAGAVGPARPDLARLQGDARGRAAGGEAFGQSGEGDRRPVGGGALSAGFSEPPGRGRSRSSCDARRSGRAALACAARNVHTMAVA